MSLLNSPMPLFVAIRSFLTSRAMFLWFHTKQYKIFYGNPQDRKDGRNCSTAAALEMHSGFFMTVFVLHFFHEKAIQSIERLLLDGPVRAKIHFDSEAALVVQELKQYFHVYQSICTCTQVQSESMFATSAN